MMKDSDLLLLLTVVKNQFYVMFTNMVISWKRFKNK